ncbi:MAG: type I restriction enzyme HsdR N-terminal domain-containing protein [Bacteroidota bacterium]
MKKLNLPEFDFTFRISESKKQIWDAIRKKYVSLTPEEWVRQNFVAWLVHHKNYPQGLIGIEKEINVNRMKKRFDIIVFNKSHHPEVLIECKAPEVTISQKVFDQIAVYNMAMKVKYLIVTNGMEHFCCTVHHEKQKYSFLAEIPEYENLFGNN